MSDMTAHLIPKSVVDAYSKAWHEKLAEQNERQEGNLLPDGEKTRAGLEAALQELYLLGEGLMPALLLWARADVPAGTAPYRAGFHQARYEIRDMLGWNDD